MYADFDVMPEKSAPLKRSGDNKNNERELEGTEESKSKREREREREKDSERKREEWVRRRQKRQQATHSPNACCTPSWLNMSQSEAEGPSNENRGSDRFTEAVSRYMCHCRRRRM
jgi:hypothetical protein